MTHEEQIEKYKRLRTPSENGYVMPACYAWAVKHVNTKGHTGLCDEYLSNSIGEGVFEDQFNERKDL